MDISSVNSDLIRGNVTTIILGCLALNDKYGYEILKEIEDRSTGQYTLKQATLYNQLKRLEKQGLVSSYDGSPDDTGGGQRRYYTLTPAGRTYLGKERSEYEYSRTILDKLVSEKEFDFSNPLPFDASELRPYSSRSGESKPEVVYKEKVLEIPVEKLVEKVVEVPVEKVVEVPVEKVVEVEKPIYLDRFGNRIDSSKAAELASQSYDRVVEVEKPVYIDRFGNPISSEQAAELAAGAERENVEAARTAEQLEEAKAEIAKRDEALGIAEENAKKQDEELASVKEQLRHSEEERVAAQVALKSIEEDRLRREEEDRKRREEEARAAREEEERRRAEQLRPAQSLDELFAKLEAKSEYDNSQNPLPLYYDPAQETYKEERSARKSIDEIFKRFDEQNAQAAATVVEEPAPAAPSPDEPSAVINRADGSFAYEKEDVNYREFFYSIADEPAETPAAQPQEAAPAEEADIRTRLYAKGYTVRPYDKGNTSEYYTFNFLQANRINRDTFLIVLGLFLLEMAVCWVSLYSRISYKYFVPIIIVGSVLCLVPTFLYLLNPGRRTRANFNFKLSILNRTMLFIELTVICILIGFFALGASVYDIDLILASIVIPAIILLNLPISSLIYWGLYRTHKYHIA